MRPTSKREAHENQMAGLVRNALLVAGHEMGDEGDHWPVIKSTIHNLAQDLEQARLERAADEEAKKHLYAQLDIMDAELPKCEPDVQTALAPKLKQLRELYDAYFSSLDDAASPVNDDEVPLYLKRAEAIIETLGGEDE